MTSPIFRYSGKGLNDLGNYDNCERENWNYALAKADLPYWVAIGVCLPGSCDSRSAANLSAMLTEQFNVSLSVTIPKEQLPTSFNAGAICTTVFFSLIFATSVMGIIVEMTSVKERLLAASR